MIDVKYTGTAVALKNCIIPISAEYACDGYVYSSAIMDIMNTIPDFDSFLEYVGSRASLSAQSPVSRKIYGTFLFCTFK